MSAWGTGGQLPSSVQVVVKAYSGLPVGSQLSRDAATKDAGAVCWQHLAHLSGLKAGSLFPTSQVSSSAGVVGQMLTVTSGPDLVQ